MTEMVATLKLENNKVVQLDPVVLPPPGQKNKEQPATEAAAKQQKHGIFSRIGAFVAGLFRSSG